MALADAVKGAKRPSQVITWSDQDGNVLDLTGATISARIEDTATTTGFNSDGTFVLAGDPTTGVFTWEYGTTDVGTAGTFNVQFTATFGVQPSPARTLKARWKVLEEI